jgi:hypothetical protein
MHPLLHPPARLCCNIENIGALAFLSFRPAGRNLRSLTFVRDDTRFRCVATQVVRKNRNLEVGIVPVGRRVFHSEKTTALSGCFDLDFLCSSSAAQIP